jgi:hypothetical protein
VPYETAAAEVTARSSGVGLDCDQRLAIPRQWRDDQRGSVRCARLARPASESTGRLARLVEGGATRRHSWTYAAAVSRCGSDPGGRPVTIRQGTPPPVRHRPLAPPHASLWRRACSWPSTCPNASRTQHATPYARCGRSFSRNCASSRCATRVNCSSDAT